MEIQRDIYLNRLLAKRGNGLVKVVTGVRRCGKSFLLFRLFKNRLLSEGVPQNRIIEIAFDAADSFALRDPTEFYNQLKQKISGDGTYYLLLDEVQLLKNFEAVLNGLLRIGNLDIYVTGSNAKFLSRDVITEFRGRGDELRLFPLSFAEFLSAYSGTREAALQEYMLYGGLPPLLYFATPLEKAAFLKNLFAETYLLDIIGRNNIRHKAELEEIVNVLASSVGSLTNPQKLSSTFRGETRITCSVATIKNYIDYLCDAFLVTKAMRYDVRGRRYINTPSKYYFTDTGLRNALLNFRQFEITHLFENIIFNELQMRGYSVDVGVVTKYEPNPAGSKVRKQLEIDFVCNQGSERCYIQAAYSMPDAKKMAQEQRSLQMTGDMFRKIIITNDCFAPHYNEEGVFIMGIYDFLLNRDSIEKLDNRV